MPPSPSLIRAVLPYTTNMPRDCAINDFAVMVDDNASPEGIGLAVANFYTKALGAQTYSVRSRLSSLISRQANACRLQWYAVDLATGSIGEPVEEATFTMPTATTNSSLPPEVAICNSWASGTAGGRSGATHRGRIFIGPLTAVVSTSNGLEVESVFRNNLRLATEELVGTLPSYGGELSVWSRKDATYYPVTRGWIDNAWDTQRRRGIDTTVRTVWPVVTP